MEYLAIEELGGKLQPIPCDERRHSLRSEQLCVLQQNDSEDDWLLASGIDCRLLADSDIGQCEHGIA